MPIFSGGCGLALAIEISVIAIGIPFAIPAISRNRGKFAKDFAGIVRREHEGSHRSDARGDIHDLESFVVTEGVTGNRGDGLG